MDRNEVNEGIARTVKIKGLSFLVHINRSRRLAGRVGALEGPLQQLQSGLRPIPSALPDVLQLLSESEDFLERFVDVDSWNESESKEDTAKFRELNSRLAKTIKGTPLFADVVDLSLITEEDRDDRIEDRERLQASLLEKRRIEDGDNGKEREDREETRLELENATWDKEGLQSEWSMERPEESGGKAVTNFEMHSKLREGDSRERTLRKRIQDVESREQSLRVDLQEALVTANKATELETQLRESMENEEDLRSINAKLMARVEETEKQLEHMDDHCIELQRERDRLEVRVQELMRELGDERSLRNLHEQLLQATLQSKKFISERHSLEGDITDMASSHGGSSIVLGSPPQQANGEWGWVEKGLSRNTRSTKSDTSDSLVCENKQPLRDSRKESFDSNNSRLKIKLSEERLLHSQTMRDQRRAGYEYQRRQQTTSTVLAVPYADSHRDATGQPVLGGVGSGTLIHHPTPPRGGTLSDENPASDDSSSTESNSNEDLSALDSLGDSCNSTRWIKRQGWHGPNKSADRQGVTWDSTKKRVKLLELGANSLMGQLPKDLGNLTCLLSLRLDHNKITGEIPQALGMLSSLQHLELQGNCFTGIIPRQLGEMAELEYLGLHENELAGPIPKELGKLSKLRHMALCNNRLSGWIPAELGMLKYMEKLYLNNNRFGGTLPSSIGKMSSLLKLRLEGNAIQGDIPPELGDLPDLQILNLGFGGLGNKFSGDVPIKALSKLSNLIWISLSGNPDLHIKKGPFGGTKAGLRKALPPMCEIHL